MFAKKPLLMATKIVGGGGNKFAVGASSLNKSSSILGLGGAKPGPPKIIKKVAAPGPEAEAQAGTAASSISPMKLKITGS